jgi:thiol-disulfide isomerase/thioredoxin
MQDIQPLAAETKGKLVFITIPSTEQHLLQFFALDANALPDLVIADMTDAADLRRYTYRDYTQSNIVPRDKRLTDAPIRKFITEYLAGQLRRSLFSETPEEADKANKLNPPKSPMALVRTIVGSQFETLVMGVGGESRDAASAAAAASSSSADVLLYVHAPWCAHCKMFEPVLAEVAGHYQNTQGARPLTVLKMDGTRNEVDHSAVRVRGYPTIYIFLAADRANPVEYDSERSSEHIVRFVDRLRADSIAA